jgi:predicted transcriptional regulator
MYITRKFIKPVLKYKLVGICLKILRLIPPEGLHVNSIFRQTGLSYKPDVEEAIDNLQKGKLITETKSPTHKQKKIKHLTKLGHEFKRLMNNINEYDNAFQRFENSIKQNFDSLDRSETREDPDVKGLVNLILSDPSPSVLRSRGWIDEEIDLYEETQYGIGKTRDFLQRNIFNALISRYAALLQDIGDNEIARDISTKIVIDEIEHHLSVIRGNYASNEINGVETVATEIENDISEFYYNPEYYMHNHHINKEIKNVLVSLLCLIIPKELVGKPMEIQIGLLKHSIQIIEKKLAAKKGAKKLILELKGNKELLDICERVLRTSS